MVSDCMCFFKCSCLKGSEVISALELTLIARLLNFVPKGAYRGKSLGRNLVPVFVGEQYVLEVLFLNKDAFKSR